MISTKNTQVKKKDGKAKKAMNAFFIYRKGIREKIIAKFGTKKSHEISKLAGACWMNEPEHVKKHYRDLSYSLKDQALLERSIPQNDTATAGSSTNDLPPANVVIPSVEIFPSLSPDASHLPSATMINPNLQFDKSNGNISKAFAPLNINLPADNNAFYPATTSTDTFSYPSQPSPALSFQSLPTNDTYVQPPFRHFRSKSDLPGVQIFASRYAQAVYEQDQRQLQYLFDAPSPLKFLPLDRETFMS